jgi:hypothetical protein
MVTHIPVLQSFSLSLSTILVLVCQIMLIPSVAVLQRYNGSHCPPILRLILITIYNPGDLEKVILPVSAVFSAPRMRSRLVGGKELKTTFIRLDEFLRREIYLCF